MIAILTFLAILVVLFLVSRVATVALTLTGLSEELASFQARSALTGCGFTTQEAEAVVSHPVRRRIIMGLMLSGSAGLVTLVSSLILSVGSLEDPSGRAWRGCILAAGVGLLGLASRSERLRRHMVASLTWALRRWARLEVRDYQALLSLDRGFTVAELKVREGDWLAHRTLRELGLLDEGITVLGVHRAAGGYVGVPDGATSVEPGDLVVLYGPADGLAALDDRRAGSEGDRQHRAAVHTEELRRSLERHEERLQSEETPP